MRRISLSLVLIRLAWTCLPQMACIHPDEFFQSIEVASGLLTDVSLLYLSHTVYTVVKRVRGGMHNNIID